MKFLLKDQTVAKFRKLNKWIWYLFLAASFFISDAYLLIEDSKITAQSYLDMLGGQNLIAISTTAMVITSCIFIPIIYTVFAEIIMNFCYNIVARRFLMALNADDFTFRARLVLILSNIIIGVISVTYFFAPKAIGIISSIIDFAVPTLLFACFYEDFRTRYLPKRNHYRVFAYVAKIYLGISVIFSFLSFINNIVNLNVEKSVLDTIAYSIDLGIKLIVAGLAYLYAKRLKIKSEEPEDNDIFIIKEEPKKNDTVFKDFNF